MSRTNWSAFTDAAYSLLDLATTIANTAEHADLGEMDEAEARMRIEFALNDLRAAHQAAWAELRTPTVEVPDVH